MSHKVLIVDDSKLARMAVIKALNALQPGWTKYEAANAEEAAALIKQSVPDLALLDFNMPGKDGLALAAELHEHHPKMVVAVVSANHQQEIVARTRASGATFLAKPLTEKALAEFLDGALQKLKAARS